MKPFHGYALTLVASAALCLTANACSSGSAETGTTTAAVGSTASSASSGGGSGTGSTTGSACGSEHADCSHQDVQSNCCAGLICTSLHACELPGNTTGGGTTGGTTGAGTSGGGAVTSSCTGGASTGTSTGSPCGGNACCHTTDCPDDYKSCQNGVCKANFCGPGTGNGTALYAPCNASGINDGLCMPVLGGPGNTANACVQGGSSPGYGCNYTRYSDGGAGSICPAGQLCDPYTGSCAFVCSSSAPAAADGGPGCAAAQTCQAVFGATGVCQ